MLTVLTYYLTNKRTQITKIDSFYSKYSAVNCEVPEGSV